MFSRRVISGIVGGLALTLCASVGSPGSATTFQEPSALCLVGKGKYPDPKVRSKPNACRLWTGYRVNYDFVPFRDAAWGTWKHRRATGRIWVRTPYAGTEERWVGGHRYAHMRVRLDTPTHERGDRRWFYARVRFSIGGGPWFAYSSGDGCDSFSPPEC